MPGSRVRKVPARRCGIDGRSKALLLAFFIQAEKGSLGHHCLAANLKFLREAEHF